VERSDFTPASARPNSGLEVFAFGRECEVEEEAVGVEVEVDETGLGGTKGEAFVDKPDIRDTNEATGGSSFVGGGSDDDDDAVIRNRRCQYASKYGGGDHGNNVRKSRRKYRYLGKTDLILWTLQYLVIVASV